MEYVTGYASPVGEIVLASDGKALTGLWFVGQRYFPQEADWVEAPALPVFQETRRWLDVYFAGKAPGAVPTLAPRGTAFQRRVWELLETIPYGQTRTYGDLARELGIASARAVGGAVGRNPISILIPCHRVVGASGRLTGYAGGLARKEALLALEGGLESGEKL